MPSFSTPIPRWAKASVRAWKNISLRTMPFWSRSQRNGR
jgi:hypothetical protein